MSIVIDAANPAGSVPADSSVDLGMFLSIRFGEVTPLAAVALVCLTLYLLGAVSLWRKGRRRWSVLSTLSFTMGCLAWFLVTGTSLNGYADDLVSVLLFQQLTLMVVAPPLLLVGAPGRLLLNATPRTRLGRPVLRLALAGYRSRIAQVLLHPAVAIAVPLAAFPALYLTDAVSWFMAQPWGHSILLGSFLVLGVIAAAPLWSRDRLPRSPSYVIRLITVLIEIQIHAVFGLILLRSAPMFDWYGREPASLGLSPALDQAIGGALVWSYGELPLLIVLVVTLSKSRQRDLRTAKRREAAEDAELDAYNAYLAAQHKKDTESDPR